jgi:hypothetical protein
MEPIVHNLILDRHDDKFQARCSCGLWETAPVSVSADTLSDAYDGMEDAHFHHLEEVECQELALA